MVASKVFAAIAAASFAIAGPVPAKRTELVNEVNCLSLGCNEPAKASESVGSSQDVTTSNKMATGETAVGSDKRADLSSKTWKDCTDTTRKNVMKNFSDQVGKDAKAAGDSFSMSEGDWDKLLSEDDLQVDLYNLITASNLFTQVDYLWTVFEAVECKLEKAGTMKKARGGCK